MAQDKGGVVYILSNPAMPGILKIGFTGRDTVEGRLRELFNTSVPVPFECDYACRVTDCSAVEKALHIAFSPSRIHPQREFFQIEAEQAIAVLKLLAVEDVTPAISEEIDKGTTQVDKDAGKRLERHRRPPLNFFEMGIQVGEQLSFASEDQQVEVTVASERKVHYKGQEYSLTRLTRELLGLDYDIQPTRFWTYKGKSLSDLYNDAYHD